MPWSGSVWTLPIKQSDDSFVCSDYRLVVSLRLSGAFGRGEFFAGPFVTFRARHRFGAFTGLNTTPAGLLR